VPAAATHAAGASPAPTADQLAARARALAAASAAASADERASSLRANVFCGEDAERGQVGIALRTNAYAASWGMTYIAALALAHERQVCTNFKDISLQAYGGAAFRAHQVRVEKLLKTLLVELVSAAVITARGAAAAARASAAAARTLYNYYGGCFSGGSLVTLADGVTRIPMRELCGGMHVAAVPVAPPAHSAASDAKQPSDATPAAAAEMCTAPAPVRVVAVFRRPANPAQPVTLLRLTPSLRITPWHPLWVPGVRAADASASGDAAGAAATARPGAPAAAIAAAAAELASGGCWVFPAELSAEQRARLWAASATPGAAVAFAAAREEGSASLCEEAGAEAAFAAACEVGSDASCEDVFNLVLEQPQQPSSTVLAGRHAALVGGIACIALGHGIVPASTATARLGDAATVHQPDPHRISAVVAHPYFGDRAAILTDAAAAASAAQAAVFATTGHYPGQLLAGPAIRDELTQRVVGMQAYTAPRATAVARGGNGSGPGDSSALEYSFCDGMRTTTASAQRGISPVHKVVAV